MTRAGDEVSLGIAQVRARLGVSGRTISRMVGNPASGFPRPYYLNGRRRWRLRELEAWETTHTARPAELEGRIANLRGASAVAP